LVWTNLIKEWQCLLAESAEVGLLNCLLAESAAQDFADSLYVTPVVFIVFSTEPCQVMNRN
jgi:hypothetical protein